MDKINDLKIYLDASEQYLAKMEDICCQRMLELNQIKDLQSIIDLAVGVYVKNNDITVLNKLINCQTILLEYFNNLLPDNMYFKELRKFDSSSQIAVICIDKNSKEHASFIFEPFCLASIEKQKDILADSI